MPFQSMSAMGAGAEAPTSQGDELPIRYQTMVQANAGLGFGSPSAYPPVPYGGMGGDPSGIGSYAYRSGSLGRPAPRGAVAGLGSFLMGSPLLRSVQILRGRGTAGLGDGAPATVAPADTTIAPAVQQVSAMLVASVALGIVVTGVSGYYVGKAVAPSRDRENKYAWWGVAAALFGGPLGLGIEAAVALEHK